MTNSILTDNLLYITFALVVLTVITTILGNVVIPATCFGIVLGFLVVDFDQRIYQTKQAKKQPDNE